MVEVDVETGAAKAVGAVAGTKVDVVAIAVASVATARCKINN